MRQGRSGSASWEGLLSQTAQPPAKKLRFREAGLVRHLLEQGTVARVEIDDGLFANALRLSFHP
jgi:hypothetical protein